MLTFLKNNHRNTFYQFLIYSISREMLMESAHFKLNKAHFHYRSTKYNAVQVKKKLSHQTLNQVEISLSTGALKLSSLRSKWSSTWDLNKNFFLLPQHSVSLQHISSLVMREPGRNFSSVRQLVASSIGEPVGKWELDANTLAVTVVLRCFKEYNVHSSYYLTSYRRK